MNDGVKIRLLCVDDHEEMRRLFEIVLGSQAEFDLVGTLESADHLEEHVANLRPDVVLLDLSMPGRRPLEALRSVRSRSAGVRFLVTTAHDNPEIVDHALDAGAHGFVTKGGEFDQLTDAIRRVARDEIVRPGKTPRPWRG
jgi:DNA-binding NarL/FixJ family response regulator